MCLIPEANVRVLYKCWEPMERHAGLALGTPWHASTLIGPASAPSPGVWCGTSTGQSVDLPPLHFSPMPFSPLHSLPVPLPPVLFVPAHLAPVPCPREGRETLARWQGGEWVRKGAGLGIPWHTKAEPHQGSAMGAMERSRTATARRFTTTALTPVASSWAPLAFFFLYCFEVKTPVLRVANPYPLPLVGRDPDIIWEFQMSCEGRRHPKLGGSPGV